MEKISRKEIEDNVNIFFDNSFISKAIKKCFSVENHPFYKSFAKIDLNIVNTDDENNLNDFEINFMHKYNFCTELKIIYDILGNNKELQIMNYTFFTLENIIDKENNYEYFLDLALAYNGLGHIKVLGMCKETGKIFVRNDGGSNSYERQNNYIKYRNYLPNNSELINFTSLLKNVILK